MAKRALVSAKDLFNDKNGENVEKSEDKSSDEKRIRLFPHKRNQFLIHLFIKLDQNGEEICDDLVEGLAEKYPEIEFNTNERHVSVINGFFCLRYHEIQSFCESIETNVKNNCFSFNCCLNSIDLFSNEEKTRSFLTITELTANRTDNSKNLLKTIEHVLSEYKNNKIVLNSSQTLSTEDYLFHSSIASFLPKYESIGQQLRQEIENRFSEPILLKVKRIYLKIGNISKTIDLK